jgi:hypothetical protein
MPAKYKLRFSIDYNCGGCLWSDNDAAYDKFGIGCLDTEIYDLNDNIAQEARIKLPYAISQKTLELDKLYVQSLNWDDPAGKSLWDKIKWDGFYQMTRDLYTQIWLTLGDEYDVIYKQE